MHHSAMEANYCNKLHALQQAGLIRELQAHPQPRFDLTVNDVKVCHYLADFAYHDIEQRRDVVCDVKGHRTEVYKLKRRLMLAVHGIEVEEARR
jgi:hypothetical protein